MNRYHIVTTWRFRASINEVSEILSDTASLPDWWPSVYLAVEELSPGDAYGVGKEVSLLTRGWLPYTLRWNFRVIEVDLPHRIVLEAAGDLVGRGVWTFMQEGPITVARYDWNVEARKPMLRALGWLLRSLFTANHNWAMRMGEQSLALELERRRATLPGGRPHLPPTPGHSGSTLGV